MRAREELGLDSPGREELGLVASVTKPGAHPLPPFLCRPLPFSRSLTFSLALSLSFSLTHKAGQKNPNTPPPPPHLQGMTVRVPASRLQNR